MKEYGMEIEMRIFDNKNGNGNSNGKNNGNGKNNNNWNG